LHPAARRNLFGRCARYRLKTYGDLLGRGADSPRSSFREKKRYEEEKQGEGRGKFAGKAPVRKVLVE